METTKQHNEFVKSLDVLIREFHEQHPDLYIERIKINNAEFANGRRLFSSVFVEMGVQPVE